MSNEYHKQWVQKNRVLRNKLNKEAHDRKKLWFKNLKSTLRCERCDFKNPAALVFHHKNSKDKFMEVSVMVNQGYGYEKILKEIEKCEVLCANCHAIEHLGE